MDQLAVPSRPLCVDMDGTLLETDTKDHLIASFLRRHFWRGGMLLVWLWRGKAYFKRRLAEAVPLQVDLLPAHPEFLRYLEEQHAAGRTLVLVSAADERIVRQVAQRFKIFSSALGSDGEINLRAGAKLKLLTHLFGPRGFDYAGNSSMDIPVWRGSAEAIVVNASLSVERRARGVAKVARVFPPHTGRLELWKRVLRS